MPQNDSKTAGTPGEATPCENLVILNPEGLSDACIREVLSPFRNDRHVVGIELAARADWDDDDPEYERDVAALARAAVISD